MVQDACKGPTRGVGVADGREQLKGMIGEKRGPSEWLLVDQDRVNAFAEATEDRQWIHVDPEAAKNGPFGQTIAHGYLTLSLLPQLAPTLMKVEKRRRGLNYGSNRVRFTAPVPAGARVRLRQKLVKVEPVEDNGFRVTSEMTMEVEGNSRPAMVAETLGIIYG